MLSHSLGGDTFYTILPLSCYLTHFGVTPFILYFLFHAILLTWGWHLLYYIASFMLSHSPMDGTFYTIFPLSFHLTHLGVTPFILYLLFHSILLTWGWHLLYYISSFIPSYSLGGDTFYTISPLSCYFTHLEVAPSPLYRLFPAIILGYFNSFLSY